MKLFMKFIGRWIELFMVAMFQRIISVCEVIAVTDLFMWAIFLSIVDRAFICSDITLVSADMVATRDCMASMFRDI